MLLLRKATLGVAPYLVAVLLLAGPASAQDVGATLPDWLVGHWDVTNIYLPSNVSDQEKEAELRGFRFYEKIKDPLGRLYVTLHPTYVDFTGSSVTGGGGRLLVVEPQDMPLSQVAGTAKAWDAHHRAVDLSKIIVSMSVETRKCYFDPDDPEDRMSNHCVGFLVARSSDRKRIILYYYNDNVSHPVLKTMYVYRRLNVP